jgi:hypothetical protein
MLLEVAQQPARRDPRMPARCLAGDQRGQLERLDEADVSNLPRWRLGDEQLVVLERSLEDGAWVPPARSTFLLPGARTAKRVYFCRRGRSAPQHRPTHLGYAGT